MLEPSQAFNRQLDYPIRRGQISRGYEADAAGVMLEARIMERRQLPHGSEAV
jgi:hypothetical protein